MQCKGHLNDEAKNGCKEKEKNKWIKMKENCDCCNRIMINKQGINNIDV